MAKQVLCCAVLLISILTFAATAHALEVVNKRSTDITVFAPPQCKPCYCPMIYCIRAPCPQQCPCPQQSCPAGQTCEQPDCVCTLECRFVPGTVVAPGSSVIVSPDETYPLAYLTVEVLGKAYNVKAGDLKSITSTAKLVVTSVACYGGVQVKLYPNPTSTTFKILCLVRGERYGS